MVRLVDNLVLDDTGNEDDAEDNLRGDQGAAWAPQGRTGRRLCRRASARMRPDEHDEDDGGDEEENDEGDEGEGEDPSCAADSEAAVPWAAPWRREAVRLSPSSSWGDEGCRRRLRPHHPLRLSWEGVAAVGVASALKGGAGGAAAGRRQCVLAVELEEEGEEPFHWLLLLLVSNLVTVLAVVEKVGVA